MRTCVECGCVSVLIEVNGGAKRKRERESSRERLIELCKSDLRDFVHFFQKKSFSVVVYKRQSVV